MMIVPRERELSVVRVTWRVEERSDLGPCHGPATEEVFPPQGCVRYRLYSVYSTVLYSEGPGRRMEVGGPASWAQSPADLGTGTSDIAPPLEAAVTSRASSHS